MATTLQPTRPLGATGVTVPVLGYGTAPLGKPDVSREHAQRCLNHAIDRGITYLDTSPDYGSEPHVGAVMQSRRDEVFLATKVNRRSHDGVLEELRESLDRLRTSHVDLIQVHAVNAWADLEQVLAPDGAVAGLLEAKAQGLVRFIGITGHARPELLGHALERYPFDTVLVALGMADRLVTSPETFVLPRVVQRNVGVIAMKVFGHGTFTRRDLALRYSLGLPGVSLAIVGMDDTGQIDANVELAADIRPLGGRGQTAGRTRRQRKPGRPGRSLLAARHQGDGVAGAGRARPGELLGEQRRYLPAGRQGASGYHRNHSSTRVS